MNPWSAELQCAGLSPIWMVLWQFIENGRQLVLLTRGAHGPADIELHEADTVKLIESVQAFGGNLPAWAKPYEDK